MGVTVRAMVIVILGATVGVTVGVTEVVTAGVQYCLFLAEGWMKRIVK